MRGFIWAVLFASVLTVTACGSDDAASGDGADAIDDAAGDVPADGDAEPDFDGDAAPDEEEADEAESEDAEDGEEATDGSDADAGPPESDCAALCTFLAGCGDFLVPGGADACAAFCARAATTVRDCLLGA